MLTPIELNEKRFKSGMGYNKRDVDAFFENVAYDYERLYKENTELKEKMSVLSEGVQYYKNLEGTLQKTLVLAEKTANETTAAATTRAEVLEREARIKADKMVEDAKKDLVGVENQINALFQQFEIYKAQFKQMLTTQSNLLDSDAFSLKIVKETIDNKLKPGIMSNIRKEEISKETIVREENNIKKSVTEIEKTSAIQKDNTLRKEPENKEKQGNVQEAATRTIGADVQKREVRRTVVPNLKREEPPKRVVPQNQKNDLRREEIKRRQGLNGEEASKRDGFISKTERSLRQGRTTISPQRAIPNSRNINPVEKQDDGFHYSSLDSRNLISNETKEMDDFDKEILKYEKKDNNEQR